MDPSLEMHANKNLIREEPFNIVDNIYFVGNTWTAAYLIDTDDGLILIDGSCHDFFELLIESIYKLGFDQKTSNTWLSPMHIRIITAVYFL